MRKIILLSFLTLDGVMQAPGGPDEDTASELMEPQLDTSDYLFGRKTFQIFENYWPLADHASDWPAVNDGTKYVLSNSVESTEWKNTVFLKSIEDIKRLKETDGKDLQVHGSGQLAQLLFEHDLVDELWLKTFPITLGTGKKLFGEGTIPAAFKLTDSAVTPSGVLFANYARAGEVKTWAVGG
jgi:dihydrofolate reductase